ncbi:MAG TPA: alpha/beta hydrolase [Chitinophagaceae bacterium]|jgi:pimeloyl-ACP methyl ester carboxylesterase|nr:alpha/beta hydrolase [Chitinophagaceae bacterium]
MEKTCRIGNHTLSYRRYGNGPAVMLVHGFGEDGSVWEDQATALAPTHTVLVPDLPGTGRSEALPDSSMEGMAAALAGLLEAEGAEKATLIGHSMGGYITLAFAAHYPDRLNAFGLFHSTAFADTSEKKESRRAGIRKIEAEGARTFLEGMVPGLYAPRTREADPELIRRHLHSVHNFSGATLVSYYGSMLGRPDRTEVWKNSPVPVLLVLGREDGIIPVKEGLKLAHMPDLTYIHILNTSGHMGMKEEPEESSRVLQRFLMKTI